jgi:hypothetical protein
MSDHTTDLSAAEKAQIGANLRLAGQFIRELVDKPEQHDVLPESGTIVLLPPDEWNDDQLTFANLEMQKLLIAQGQNPIIWAVGMPSRTGPQVTVHWPILREDQIAISYDRNQDTLKVALSQTDRPTMGVRVHPYVIALVDPETRLVISYTIPTFLTVVAPKSLPLFELLLRSSTKLIGTTPDEVIEQRNRLVHGGEQPAREQMTPSGILAELARSIA